MLSLSAESNIHVFAQILESELLCWNLIVEAWLCGKYWLPVYGYYLLVLRESIDGWLYLTNDFFFEILLGAIAKLEPLISAETIMGNRLLLDRFLTVLNREDWKLLCRLRLMYFFVYSSMNYVWVFWDHSYKAI